MPIRETRGPSRTLPRGAWGALVLCLSLASGPARSAGFDLECQDAGAGVRSLSLLVPPGVEVTARSTSATTTILEVGASELPGLPEGPAPCAAARQAIVVWGRTLGAPVSRIVVQHEAPAPTVLPLAGKLRLVWVPGATPPPAAPRVARADERARPPRQEEAPERPSAPATRLDEETAPPEPAPEPPPRRDDTRGRPETTPQAPPAAEPPARPRPAAPPPERALAPEPQPAVEALPEYTPLDIAPTTPPRPPAPLDLQSDVPKDFVRLESAQPLAALVPTEVRSGAGQRYRTLRTLAAGERVRVDGRAGDWMRLDDGGWVFGAWLTAEDDRGGATTRRATVTAVTTPVHAGPGGQFEVVTELYQGQQVVLDEVSGDWAHVRNGGWVRRSALDATARR